MLPREVSEARAAPLTGERDLFGVCGLPAETPTYSGDAAHDAHPGTILSVVAKAGGDTYQAAVVQAIEPGTRRTSVMPRRS
jgi:hypothetical protein